jgi:hypothetical protein
MGEKVQRKTAKPRKRQWQRPQIKSGKLFESNSLACLKNPASPDAGEECQLQGAAQS